MFQILFILVNTICLFIFQYISTKNKFVNYQKEISFRSIYNGRFFDDQIPHVNPLFCMYVDVRYVVPMMMFAVGKMYNLMYLLCVIILIMSLNKYIRAGLDGIINFSVGVSMSMLMSIWLAIYFNHIENTEMAYVMVILCSMMSLWTLDVDSDARSSI